MYVCKQLCMITLIAITASLDEVTHYFAFNTALCMHLQSNATMFTQNYVCLQASLQDKNPRPWYSLDYGYEAMMDMWKTTIPKVEEQFETTDNLLM